jgi:hydrogenase nickel incorporation protein HypA/HybF
MHEFSLASAILAQSQEIARNQGEGDLREVVVSLGPLSGVEPLLLMSAFDQLTADARLHCIRLTIENTPLAVLCRDCKEASELVEFDFHCLCCGGTNLRITSGDQIILKRVELAASESEAPCTAR